MKHGTKHCFWWFLSFDKRTVLKDRRARVDTVLEMDQFPLYKTTVLPLFTGPLVQMGPYS